MEDCVCSRSTEWHLQRLEAHSDERKYLINKGYCCVLAVLDRSAVVETGCGLAAVACRAFKSSYPLGAGPETAHLSLVLGEFWFDQSRNKSIIISKRI